MKEKVRLPVPLHGHENFKTQPAEVVPKFYRILQQQVAESLFRSTSYAL